MQKRYFKLIELLCYWGEGKLCFYVLKAIKILMLSQRMQRRANLIRERLKSTQYTVESCKNIKYLDS